MQHIVHLILKKVINSSNVIPKLILVAKILKKVFPVVFHIEKVYRNWDYQA